MSRALRRRFDGLFVTASSGRRFVIYEPAWWHLWRWATIGAAKLWGTSPGEVVITIGGVSVTARALPVGS